MDPLRKGNIKRNQKNKFHKITDNKNVYCIHKVHYENINLEVCGLKNKT